MVRDTLDDDYADMLATLIQEYDSRTISVKRHKAQLVVSTIGGARYVIAVECIRGGKE